jgi:hypothetical protein
LLGKFQIALDLGLIMSVNGANVADVKFFKERGGHQKVFGLLLPFGTELDD